MRVRVEVLAQGRAEVRDRMLSFEELNLLLGTPELLEAGRRYAGE